MKIKFFVMMVFVIMNVSGFAGGINKYIEDPWQCLDIYWDDSEEDVC